ncbi:MAG: prepilin peptidase [Planctomycetia bacterium]|nr:prepilin peptidase [Planctomycetia bacterium]
MVLLGLFILGTVFGSMLNVAIYRLPREERLWPSFKYMVHPPSHCPRCRTPIRFYDNIPIIGWIKLRGRCRACLGTISIRYPLIETLTGLLFVLLYWFEVPSIWGWSAYLNSSVWHPLGPGPGPSPGLLVHCRFALHVVLLVSLIASTFIDIDLRIIPDSATLPAMAIAVLAHTIAGNLYIAPLWYQTPAMSAGAWGFFLPVQGLIPANAMPGWLANWPVFIGVPAWITAHPHLHGFCLSVAGIIVGGGWCWRSSSLCRCGSSVAIASCPTGRTWQEARCCFYSRRGTSGRGSKCGSWRWARCSCRSR